jgi:outer membrane protein assembly factor BamB
VFVGGWTQGNLDGNVLTGNSDFFVTKYNSSGVKQWTRQLGASGADTPWVSVATDSIGNVFVGGYTNGSLDGNALMGTRDYFVTKYNSSGVKQWTRQLGQNGKETYSGLVATDSSGNVFVGGNTNGGLDGTPLTGTADLFVTKYNAYGVKQWTQQLGDSGKVTFGWGVATDSSGNVFVGGYTMGNLDGNTVAGNNDFYFFVTKYNSSGVTQWTRQLGASGAITEGYGVATDSNGNVFVGGWTQGNLDGNVLTGNSDIFVTKYNSSGVKQWTQQLGASGASTESYNLATDSSGNVFVGGYTNGSLDGNALMGTSDYFVTKYNSSGVKQWTRQLGASGADTGGYGVATDSSGNVFVGGYTMGNLDGNTLLGTADFFVTKFDSAGTKQ